MKHAVFINFVAKVPQSSPCLLHISLTISILVALSCVSVSLIRAVGIAVSKVDAVLTTLREEGLL